MNKEMQENIKIGLLGLIAVLLLVQTFTGGSNNDNSRRKSAAAPNLPQPQISQQQPSQQQPQIQPQVQQPAQAPDVTNVVFSETQKDFGKVKQGKKLEHVFTTTNDGDKDLVISSINADPGATVVSYPTDPVPPGQTAEIKVEYDTGNDQGQQKKLVHINLNAPTAHQHLELIMDVE